MVGNPEAIRANASARITSGLPVKRERLKRMGQSVAVDPHAGEPAKGVCTEALRLVAADDVC